MGGDQRDDSFTPGGGTFRGPFDPKMVAPLFQQTEDAAFSKFHVDKGDHQKIYDYEALRRMLELLDQNRQQKPYGTPDNANIGF